MHIFDRIENAKSKYKFERRAGPQYAWAYFHGPIKEALSLLGHFSVLVEKVRLGEVPNNPAYTEQIETALEAIRRIEPYLGLKRLDVYIYKREAVDCRIKEYHTQYARRHREAAIEIQALIRMARINGETKNIPMLERRLEAVRAKLDQL